jgi:hypothetical protein
MNINEYLMSQREIADPAVFNDDTFPLAMRIACKDGFSLSVQANWGAYCTPRQNVGPWREVEVGFPSAIPLSIMAYAENVDNPTETVYGYVPIELVEALVEEHGGPDENWLDSLRARTQEVLKP